MQRFATFFMSITTSLVCFAACNGNNGNGVDDVRLACEIRQSWTRASEEACQTCRLSSTLRGDCECKKDEYRGACEDQTSARTQDPDCIPDIESCLFRCEGTDCNCIESCFEGHAQCKVREAALAGCIADVCDDACR